MTSEVEFTAHWGASFSIIAGDAERSVVRIVL